MSEKKKSYIVLGHAKKQNYTKDYVALPMNYGTPEYFAREDVKEIRRVVFESLDKLNEKIDLADEIKGRHIIIKPNLVQIYHKIGFKYDDMPQSTDPRVMDAVVDYLRKFSDKITIAESTASQMGTSGHFKTTGLDRVAKRYGAEVLALEDIPIDRYILPKAEVMKEVAIPRILSEVVRGEAYYVSVPKMKTNPFTGATLGFKNAMGTLPSKMRYKNHGYQIDKKLVDLLYLFKPNLIVIDGIVGAEGETPGPVDPVDSRMVVVSNQAVEADRLTTDMMGIGSQNNKLIMEAVSRGFDDPDVEIIGEPRYMNFRQADRSLLTDRFRKNWPKIKVFIGPPKPIADKHGITDIHSVTPEQVKALEYECRGGCTPGMTCMIEMYLYAKKPVDLEFALIYGLPVEIDGKQYYFDQDGKPYTKEEIDALPMKKMAMGECTKCMWDICDSHAGGCIDIGAMPTALLAVTGKPLPNLSPSMTMFRTMIGAAKTFVKRMGMTYVGERYDLPYNPADWDKILPIPELTEEQQQMDYIPWPMPYMTREEKIEIVKNYSVT